MNNNFRLGAAVCAFALSTTSILAVGRNQEVQAAVATPLTATTLSSQISGASRSNSVGLIQPTLKEVMATAPWKFNGLARIPIECNPRRIPSIVIQPVPCIFGPTGVSKTVVLVGASHAGMWLPALISMAYQDQFRLASFIYAGCPAVIMDFSSGLIQFDGSIVSAESCGQWNKNVPTQINALKPDVVIIGGGTEVSASVPVTFNQDIVGMSNFLDQVNAPTKIIVGSTVYRTSTQETARCVNSHISSVTACNATYNGFNAKDPTTLLLRRDQLVASATGARLVPLISLTCTPSTKTKPTAVCPPVINHRLVYADGSHLSDSFVIYVTPVFRSAVNAALATR